MLNINLPQIFTGKRPPVPEHETQPPAGDNEPIDASNIVEMHLYNYGYAVGSKEMLEIKDVLSRLFVYAEKLINDNRAQMMKTEAVKKIEQEIISEYKRLCSTAGITANEQLLARLLYDQGIINYSQLRKKDIVV